MTRSALFVMLAMVATAASSALTQQISKSHERWIERDVAAIATREETRLFRTLPADQDRDAFQHIFWLRRDPDLATRTNEFKDIYEERVGVANDRLPSGSRPGFLTDMGQVFLLFGFPADMTSGRASESSVPQAAPQGQRIEGSDTEYQTGGSGPGPARFQTWTYPADPALGLAQPLELQFRAQPSFGYRLLKSEELDERLESRRQSLVSHPDIRYEVDSAGNLLPPSVPSSATPATEILESLMDSRAESEAIPFRAAPAHFRSTDGETYVPVLFEVPIEALEPSSASEIDVTFFGAIVDESGEISARFEERVWRTTTTPDGRPVSTATFEMPLQLAPGSYQAYLGVRDENGETHGSRVSSLAVRDFDDDAVQISTVLVYRNASESVEHAGTPGNAFQFGRIKLDPVGSDALGPEDAVGLFFYVYGARGSDLTAKYVFYQGAEEKAQTRPQPLLVSDGIAVGNDEIPLASFAAGDYRVLVEVRDPASGATYRSSAFFTLQQ